MIAIDLGSNTIRFIEFDGKSWGKSFEKIVRTAESLHQTHCIGTPAVERIIRAIHEAKQKVDFKQQPIRAYTTAAMRLASNTDEVLSAIEKATGIVFEIIDGEKEALLTLDAVCYRLGLLGNKYSGFVLADIGGGSTEITIYDQLQTKTVSLNFGIVTLAESGEKNLEEKIGSFKETIQNQIGLNSLPLVLTAGTPTTIAAYLNGMDYQSYDPQKINGYRLHLNDCYRVYKKLLTMEESERTRYVGVGRENLIIAGILMVITIFEVLLCDEAIVVDDGLREGIALEYYKMT